MKLTEHEIQVMRAIKKLDEGNGVTGSAICEELRISTGTIHPTLSRLERYGLVTSDWEKDVPPWRPRRRLYRLSEDGAQELAAVPVVSPRSNPKLGFGPAPA